jgi:hypothetical protein
MAKKRPHDAAKLTTATDTFQALEVTPSEEAVASLEEIIEALKRPERSGP